ncbi:MAG: hypothetical protein EZS28_023612 [Streblomastix strix]|uniref:Uncharacterized protein n=1 Tax=Streblomastix strix TaxID=222440 RepID=A0A5J4VEJ8_9EUKA|nr:MAG: hypothetical protein EZS28_023612 [Streblomastix strix]
MELINIGYGRALTLSLCTAGGAELQGDFEIKDGLSYISIFLNEFYNGRNNYDDQPSFPPQPNLSKACVEQIEDEGGIEEVESQLTNKGKNFNIKIQAIKVKGRILNFFIDWSNSIPFWYW